MEDIARRRKGQEEKVVKGGQGPGEERRLTKIEKQNTERIGKKRATLAWIAESIKFGKSPNRTPYLCH